MIRMDQYELMRTAHRVYGKSIRQIARETGHHRKTVKQAILGAEPQYRRKKQIRKPVMDAVSSIVDQWLQSDQLRPRKQRHTGRRIYHRLVAEYHFEGCESTVVHWVSARKKALGIDKAEAMIPLCPSIGKEAEVDWGEARVMMGGREQTVKLFCMRSRYSGKSFVKAYPCERQEMFFDGHIHAFTYFGGVYPTLVYDNLTSAVKKVLVGKKRIEQESFVSFRAYYTFEARYCNPGKGHEKGGVEGIVGYARRNFLVPYVEVADFEELNQYLIECSQGHSEGFLLREGKQHWIEKADQEEKSHLLALPAKPWHSPKILSVGVNPYQLVRVDQNCYSVPSHYVGCQLSVHLDCWSIRFYDQQKEVASHPRQFGHSQWHLNPLHYLKALHRKPGAFDEAKPILQWRSCWPEIYEMTLSKLRERQGYSRGTREFIEILQLHHDYPASHVQSALELVHECHAWSLASVKHLLKSNWSESASPLPLDSNRLPGITDQRWEAPKLNHYNHLLN